MRLLCKSSIFFLAVVLSIRAAPLTDGPIEEALSTVTDISEDISSPISILLGLNSGDNFPTSTSSPVIISQHQNTNNGNYEYGYKTSNGIEVEEKGTQKEFVGADGEKAFGTVSSGKYSYIMVDGDGNRKKMTVTWTADENGFRPIITFSDDVETEIVNPL